MTVETIRQRRRGMRRFAAIASIGFVLILVGAGAGVVGVKAAAANPATKLSAPKQTTLIKQSRQQVPAGQNAFTLLTVAAPSQAAFLGSACANAWNCWAVGGIFGNNGNSFTGVTEHWDGTSWKSVPNQAPADHNWIFTAVSCASADSCWAVGGLPHPSSAPTPIVEHWNGTNWSIVSIPSLTGYFLGISCAGSTECWASGTRVDGMGNPSTAVLERWNGSSWAIVNTPSTGQTHSGLNAVSCTTASACWAVGWSGPNPQETQFLPIFPAEANGKGLVERWNGASWSIVSSPQSPDGLYLSGVTCTTADNCWSVGSTTSAAGFAESTAIERWNGSSWSFVPSPSLSGSRTGDFLRQVTCPSSSDCVAVGATGLQTGFSASISTGAAAWNGTSWTELPTAAPTARISFLSGVACAGTAECFAAGFTINPQSQGIALGGLFEHLSLPQGYLLTASDGGVFSFGSNHFLGSMAGKHLVAPVVGSASPDGDGYWLVGSDGGVFSFGEPFEGSESGTDLVAPIVGIAPTSDSSGYWLVGSDGGVFSFGDAHFYGSMGGRHLTAPIVGIAPTSDGGGYWLVASDGGVFSFGDAAYHGSEGGLPLSAPIVGIAPTPDGGGYWLTGSDGSVFSFGNAEFLGSMHGTTLAAPIKGIYASPDAGGYWLVGSDGGVFGLGDALYEGSEAGKALAAPVVAIG